MKMRKTPLFQSLFVLLAAIGLMQPGIANAQIIVGDGGTTPYTFTDGTFASDAFTLNANWVIQANGVSISSGGTTQNAYGEFAIGAGSALGFNFASGTQHGFLKSGDGELAISNVMHLYGSTAAPATVDVTGGKLDFLGTQTMHIGSADGQHGIINISNDAIVTISSETLIANSSGSQATINISNKGQLVLANNTIRMSNNGGTSNINLKDEASLSSTGTFYAGQRGPNPAQVVFNGKSSGAFRDLFIGSESNNNGPGIFILNDEATMSVSNRLLVGRYGPGSLSLHGQEIKIGTELWVGDMGGPGVINLTSGKFNSNSNAQLNLGVRAKGQLKVSGDAMFIANGLLLMGYGASAGAKSVVYQTGGTVNANAGITLGNGSTASAAYYLADGTLNTTTIANGNGGSCERIFSVTGGTLNADTISTAVTQRGGALSPGGDDKIGSTTINAAYTLGSSDGGVNTAANLALAGEAFQSTTYGAAYPANNAFDGNYTNITHTRDGAYSWLEVDLGGIYDLGQVNLWNRTGSPDNTDIQKRLTEGGYYFEVYDENKALVWRSEITDKYDYQSSTDPGYTISFGGANPNADLSLAGDTAFLTANPDATATGRYLRLKRNYGAGEFAYLSISEMEVYAVEDASEGRFRIEVDAANNNWDKVLFGTNGVLNLEDGSILELAFLDGIGAEGDWQIFDPADFGSSILGEFSDIYLSTPDWAFTQESLDNFYATGVLSTQSAGQGVPEPATWVMMVLAAAGMVFTRRVSRR